MSFNYGQSITANSNLVNGLNAFASAIGGTMGFLDSLFGSHSEANSAKMSYDYSKKLKKYDYKLNRKTRQTSFGDTRMSLENAGYNPILAVGQQAQGATYGDSLNVQDPESENLQNRLNQITAMTTAKLNSAQAYNQIQQGRLTTQQASNLISQNRLNSAQTALTNLQSQSQAINNLHLPAYLKSQIKLNTNTAQAQMMNANSNYVSALANQQNAVSNRINAQTNSAVGASTAWRNYNPITTTSIKAGPFGYTYTGNEQNNNSSSNKITPRSSYGYNNYSIRNYQK